MGFLSDLGKVVSNVIVPGNQYLINQFSGKSQQEDANAKAMESWHLMNDYNHPIQQMERLKAAGLNPLLVYGSGSVAGNTTSSPALTGGGVSTGLETLFKVGSKTLSAMQGVASLDNTYANTAAQNAAAGASGAQAANLQAQAAYNEIRNTYAKDSLIADIDYKKALADKTRAEADLAQGEAEIFGSIGGVKGVGAAGKVMSGVKGATRGVANFMRGMFK